MMSAVSQSTTSGSESERSNIRVIFVGVGGATCSGKSTLAKTLRRILPNSVVIHQDDFGTPSEHVPMHPIHNVPDWDNAETSVDYPSLVAFLRRVKETGELHAGHKTHDSLRMRSCVTLSDEAVARWGELFAEKVRARERERGERIVWGLLDGFLVYWCKDVVRELDARLFLRVPRAVLQQRRKDWGAALITANRPVYGDDRNDGVALFQDPPFYFEEIAMPAYVDAHRHLFQNGDVEHGQLNRQGQDEMVLIEETNLEKMVEMCCPILLREMEK